MFLVWNYYKFSGHFVRDISFDEFYFASTKLFRFPNITCQYRKRHITQPLFRQKRNNIMKAPEFCCQKKEASDKVSRRAVSDCTRCSIKLTAHFLTYSSLSSLIKLHTLYLKWLFHHRHTKYWFFSFSIYDGLPHSVFLLSRKISIRYFLSHLPSTLVHRPIY